MSPNVHKLIGIKVYSEMEQEFVFSIPVDKFQRPLKLICLIEKPAMKSYCKSSSSLYLVWHGFILTAGLPHGM